ncbi:MAG: hypothetical protein GEV10_05760 [Streptosporangiales bacterium]|nr:hypothetical protein [Streptosporangiales bacterium]
MAYDRGAARRSRRQRRLVVTAAVVAPVLYVLSVVGLLGGFAHAPYRAADAREWVDSGQFRVRVIAVTWSDSPITSRAERGAHELQFDVDIHNTSRETPATLGTIIVLSYRMDGREERLGGYRVLDPTDSQRVQPGFTRRVRFTANVEPTRRSAPPRTVDVLVLGTERTLGDTPDDFRHGNDLRWWPTSKVVATVPMVVRT